LNLFINLFSIPGLYRHIIGQAGFPLGNRRRERFPFDTHNMDLLHVAIWLHDHGLSPDDLQIGDIEQWAHLVRGLPPDNEQQDVDGNWELSPRNIGEAIEEHHRQISDLHVSFQYPPRMPFAHARSWSTAAKIAVDRERRNIHLARLHSSIAAKEEEEAEMEVKDTTRPTAPNADQDNTAGG